MNVANPTELKGGCACGAIRYRLLDSPMIVQACHCRDCQRLTGSAFVVNMWIEADKLQLQGKEPACVHLQGGSGKPHDVFFCPDCGTTLFSRYHAAPGRNYFVRAGTLDDPGAVQPAAHIHTRTKMPWLQLDGSIPVFEDFYDLRSFWPADSLQRFLANAAPPQS